MVDGFSSVASLGTRFVQVMKFKKQICGEKFELRNLPYAFDLG